MKPKTTLLSLCMAGSGGKHVTLASAKAKTSFMDQRGVQGGKEACSQERQATILYLWLHPQFGLIIDSKWSVINLSHIHITFHWLTCQISEWILKVQSKQLFCTAPSKTSPTSTPGRPAFHELGHELFILLFSATSHYANVNICISPRGVNGSWKRNTVWPLDIWMTSPHRRRGTSKYTQKSRGMQVTTCC